MRKERLGNVKVLAGSVLQRGCPVTSAEPQPAGCNAGARRAHASTPHNLLHHPPSNVRL
jgi:hypothetical protein